MCNCEPFYLRDYLGKKKLFMFAVTRPSLLKSINPKICKKNIENLFKNIYVSLGTTTSSIFLLKSQGFVTSVPFNVIEMVYFLVNGLKVFKFDYFPSMFHMLFI